MREMRDTLRATFGRMFRPENRRAQPRRGSIERLHAFHSEVFGNEREVTVYLPPSYHDRQDVRYPVLYMQDGQNLFDADRAFVPGQHWRLGESADAAIAARQARSMIIVGVDNTGSSRIDEYTPTRDEKRNAGGRAADYARFLIDELKPAIDAQFRTLPDRDNTAAGGSSLGGLVTLYLGLTHPDVFGALAVMSPSVWWDSRSILQTVDAYPAQTLPRIWLDIGGREGREALEDARLLREHLTAKGWEEHLGYYEDRRADHSERAWAKRAPMMLEFLFPAT